MDYLTVACRRQGDRTVIRTNYSPVCVILPGLENYVRWFYMVLCFVAAVIHDTGTQVAKPAPVGVMH